MNFRRVTCAVGLALAVVASSQVAASADTPAQSYLLSLGDSLAAGYQPAHGDVPAGDTDQGYADQLAAQLQSTDSSLLLHKRGCSGETTTSMLNGGPYCAKYDDGLSQVDAAAKFLTGHPDGQVKYITIDIGANDVQTCVNKTTGSIDIACAVQGVATLAGNLPVILAKIKAASAASNNTPTIVGMNYYNPFLVSFLKPGGSQGIFLTAVTSLAQFVVDTVEENEYRAVGARVADVSGAFQSYDFLAPQKDLPGVGPVPVPVFNICTLTYICSVGDIHANVNGYGVIANAFVKALDPAPATALAAAAAPA